MKHFSILRITAIVSIVVMGVLAGASVGTAQRSAAIVKVRVGDGPYFDFILFHVAHELGIDRQLGVDLQFKVFPQPPGAQLRRGDLDIIFSSPTTGFPLYENFPEYRAFMITDIFKGFTLIGRKGKVKPYSQYLVEAGGNLKLAKQRFVRGELPGKSFCALKTEELGTLAGLLALRRSEDK